MDFKKSSKKQNLDFAVHRLISELIYKNVFFNCQILVLEIGVMQNALTFSKSSIFSRIFYKTTSTLPETHESGDLQHILSPNSEL